MERLAGFAGITQDDVVLDVGCGDGRALLHLASTLDGWTYRQQQCF